MSQPKLKVQQLDAFQGWVDVCPVCLGTGKVHGKDCRQCKKAVKKSVTNKKGAT